MHPFSQASWLASSMIASGAESNNSKAEEDSGTSVAEDISATASRNHSPVMMIVAKPPVAPKPHNTETFPSCYVAQPSSNSSDAKMILARSFDTASMGALDTLPFHHEFKIIQSPPLPKARLPWQQDKHVIFLLGRGMVARYIPTFLYFWLCRFDHGPPHQTFDRSDLRCLMEFNRVMKLLDTIVTRWCGGGKVGKTLFGTQVVMAWNNGQQLFFNLIRLLLAAQSRAFAMTGRKETDPANWVHVGKPHEREGKLFFRQLNDEDLGFNAMLFEFNRWNNACWIWLTAPGSESLLF